VCVCVCVWCVCTNTHKNSHTGTDTHTHTHTPAAAVLSTNFSAEYADLEFEVEFVSGEKVVTRNPFTYIMCVCMSE
jgi:hypothetical protein